MGDWVDVAWSVILDQCPTMGDPARYRTAMHQALWLGTEPELTPEERRQAETHKAEEARQAIGTPVASSKLDEMKALMQKAADLRESVS